MTASPTTTEREFIWSASYAKRDFKVQRSIRIPNDLPLKEIVFRVMQEEDLPCYVEDDLTQSLSDFVSRETELFYDDAATAAIEKFRKEGDVEALAARWARDFKEEHLCYASPEEETPESKFPTMYHTLIHSPALDTMLNLEHSYALAVGDMVRERDQTLNHLQKR